MCPLQCCRNIWEATALVYAGYEATRIEIISYAEVEFYFDAPSLDAQGIVDDYQGRKLVLSDAKAFTLAFTKLNRGDKLTEHVRGRGSVRMRYKRDF